MARSRIPGTFWLLKRLGGGAPDRSLCCNDLGYLYAFSDIEKAYDFQYGRLDSAWTTQLIQQRQIPELVQELQQHGYKGLCFDCAADGSKGNVLARDQLERLAEQPRS